MTNKVEIGGDGEKSDMLVCARLTSPLMMPDNEVSLCAECAAPIQHRPHVPKKPRKLCLKCAEPLIKASAAAGKMHTVVTPETVADLEYLRKKKIN